MGILKKGAVGAKDKTDRSIKKSSKSKKWIVILGVMAVGLLICFAGYFVAKDVFPLKYENYIFKYAKEYESDPYLIMGIIRTESSFVPEAVSGAGAIGLMQIMDDIESQTGSFIAEKLGVIDYTKDKLYDPEINIKFGIWYFNWLSMQFDGNLKNVLAAYNAGIGNVQKWLADERYSSDGRNLDKIPYKETENFINRVKLYRDIYSILYGKEISKYEQNYVEDVNNTDIGGENMAVFTNPIAENGNDPWIIYHEGMYYYCYSGGGGVRVAAMKNFYELGSVQARMVWVAPENTEYSKELWAPELHYIDGEWYIYIAADDGNNDNHRMYVLRGTSQDPMDRFEFVGKITDDTNRWAIDGTVMQYKDKLYFIWSGWQGSQNVRQNLYIAPMSDPCTISGERVLISTPELSWELNGGNPKINEGPVAISRDGVYHIVYSASGSWCDDYCLGLLTLKGDNPLDPNTWEKSAQPILEKSEGVFGPGHCSFTTSPDGNQTFVIYHANAVSGTGWGGRSVRAQEVMWDERNYPVIGKPIDYGVEVQIVKNQ